MVNGARTPPTRAARGIRRSIRSSKDNVKNLQVAWTWKFDNFGTPAETVTTETTPLMVNGVLYFTAGQRRTVVAANAGTGETLWTWRPDEGARFDQAPRKVHRGVAYWTDGTATSASSSSRRASSWSRSNAKTGAAGRRASARAASSICSSSSIIDVHARSDRQDRQQLAAGDLERRDRRRPGADAGRPRQQGERQGRHHGASTSAPARSSGRSTRFRARASPATRRG